MKGFSDNLKEGGGDGNEEGGGGPNISPISNDVGPIMSGRQVSSERVTNSLHHRSEKGQRAQPGRARVQCFADFFVHSRQQ